MAASKDRKIKFAYFVAALITLGFLVPVSNIALLPAYLTFTSSLAGIAALMFGANVVDKKLTQESYMKKLDILSEQEKLED